MAKYRTIEIMRLNTMFARLDKLEIKLEDIKKRYPKHWFNESTNPGRQYTRILKKYCKLVDKVDKKEWELFWR